MRRDWFWTKTVVTVAAPLMLTLTAALAAAPPGVEAIFGPAKQVAQQDRNAAVTAITGDNAVTTGAASSGVAPINQGGAPVLTDDPGNSGAQDGSSASGCVPRGDDQLPTANEAKNNPYITPSASGSLDEGAMGGIAKPFLPPTAPKSPAEQAQEAGSEMAAILGDEVYNRRVNITTPPDTDVAEVIRLLAERANLNFLYAEGTIKGRVTLNLRDVPLGVALQSLLSTHDLSIIREGENVMRIVPRKEIRQTLVETKTIYIKLNWVPAATVVDTLSNVFANAGSVNSVKAHKESNTVIITDTPPNVALMRDLVYQIDVPEKQVMIEARMVELLIADGRDLGSQTTIEKAGSINSTAKGTLGDNAAHTETVNTIVYDADGKPSIVSKTIAVPAKAVDTFVSSLLTGGGAPSLTFGGVISIFGKDFDIASTLDGLESRNVANILANPRIITLNNQEALIDIKREIPYIEAQQGASQQVTAATVKFKDAGVKLAVLPTITNNGFVRMRLEPEQDILAGRAPNPGGGTIPIIDRRTAVTNVIVKDEDTVVLGGLREIDSLDTKTAYPWLGQTPIIGWFFKKDSKAHSKNDLMLFVTPHIVKAPLLTPAENYKYSRVDAHWDLPDYFFDDSVEQRENHHRGESDMSAGGFVNAPLMLPPVPASGSSDASAAGATEAVSK